MVVTLIKAKPIEEINVAGEMVKVEGSGEPTYKTSIAGVEEVSTAGHYARCVEYWRGKMQECEAKMLEYQAVVDKIALLKGK